MSSQPTEDDQPHPQYIYKIVPSSVPIPSPLPESLPVSDLDRSSGFLHFSTAEQIPNTLKHFFPSDSTSEDSVYILKVPYAPLAKAGKVKWEDPQGHVCGDRPGEGLFPHVYDGGELKLGKDDIEEVKVVVSEKGVDGWAEGLEEMFREG